VFVAAMIVFPQEIAGFIADHLSGLPRGEEENSLGLALPWSPCFLVVAYLRMDSSAPPGQEPLATLTAANFPVFQETFDRSMEGPRFGAASFSGL